MSSTTNSSSTGEANNVGNRKLLEEEEEEEEAEAEAEENVGSTNRNELEQQRRTSSTSSKSSLSTSQRRITAGLLRPLLPDSTPSASDVDVVDAESKTPVKNTAKNSSNFSAKTFLRRFVARKSLPNKTILLPSAAKKCVDESTALRHSFANKPIQNSPLTSPSSPLAPDTEMSRPRGMSDADGDFSDRRPSQAGRKSAWIQLEEDINRQKTLVAQDPLRTVLQRLSEISAEGDSKTKTRHFAPTSWLRNLCKSRRFKNAKMEELYRQYFLNSNKTSLIAALLYATILDLTLFCVYYATDQRSPIYGTLMVVLLVGFIILLIIFNRLKSANKLHCVILYASLTLLALLDFLNVIFMKPYSAASNAWCVCLLIFLIYTMIPLPLNVSLISGITLGVIHFLGVCWIYFLQPSAIITAQVSTNSSPLN